MNDPPTRDEPGHAGMPDAPPLACLCYVSSATKLLDPDELERLLDEARTRNASRGLTGLLLHCDGSFMQYLEGPEPELAAAWRSIQRDPRHSQVTLLFQANVAFRRFADWRMAFSAAHRPDFDSMVASAKADPAVGNGGQPSGPRIVADLLRHFWDMHQPGRLR